MEVKGITRSTVDREAKKIRITAGGYIFRADREWTGSWR